MHGLLVGQGIYWEESYGIRRRGNYGKDGRTVSRVCYFWLVLMCHVVMSRVNEMKHVIPSVCVGKKLFAIGAMCLLGTFCTTVFEILHSPTFANNLCGSKSYTSVLRSSSTVESISQWKEPISST